MTGAWPWLAVAGMGALHGLNPATGWLSAAAWGVRCGDRAQALRALAPIAIGHVVSVGLVAVLVAAGLAAQRGAAAVGGGWTGPAVVATAIHLAGHSHPRARRFAGHAGLALGAFTVACVQGAGMMLVPALIPVCASGSPMRAFPASGSLVLVSAAALLHLAAMELVHGLKFW